MNQKTLRDEAKFNKVLQSVERTIFITTSIIQKLELSQDGSTAEMDAKSLVNACLNIAAELKTIPFSLNEIEKILMDIIKSIHSNRTDLEESINILINSTGQQLTKVTDATEKATSNIMNITDHILSEHNEMISDIAKVKTLTTENPEIAELLSKMEARVEGSQADVYKIWDFLQFQDITTQQIEYAYNLLREAEGKLLKVSDRLGGLDDVKIELTEKHNTAYDPDADFDYASDRQEAIDDLLNNFDAKSS